VVPRLVLLETVRFDSTGLDLPLDMQERLRSTVRFIRAFPEYPVVLEAHAAGGEKKKAAPKARAKARKGGPPPTPGVSLPRRRAEELRTYLHEVQRIPLEQLHVRDLGESRPLANSATAAGRRQNQRIEIVVRDQVEAEVDTSAAPPPASTAPPGRRR
jgi:outer membrane protein OmpA-like peptidoglycan-associated protein